MPRRIHEVEVPAGGVDPGDVSRQPEAHQIAGTLRQIEDRFVFRRIREAQPVVLLPADRADLHAAELPGEVYGQRDVLPRAALRHMLLEELVARDVGEAETPLGVKFGDRAEGDGRVVIRAIDAAVGARLIDHAVDHLHFAVQPIHGGDRHTAEFFEFGEGDDSVVAPAEEHAEQRYLREFRSCFHFFTDIFEFARYNVRSG